MKSEPFDSLIASSANMLDVGAPPAPMVTFISGEGAHVDAWEREPGKLSAANKMIGVFDAPDPVRDALSAQLGPWMRLPPELRGKILSKLDGFSSSTPLAPRAVSRAFYRDSLLWQPKLNDHVASVYFARLLSQGDFAQTEETAYFFAHWAPWVRTIDLNGKYTEKSPAREELLHRLLSERKETIHSLILTRCEAVNVLPEGLIKFGGDLHLDCTSITQLPQGLEVVGDLNLSFTDVTELPIGLTVGGDLDLSWSAITQLPPGLSVGGSLRLRDTELTQLPRGLKVGGTLNLRETGITQLPRGLTFGGGLDLSDTGITQLPHGLTVNGDLILCNTGVAQLPQGLTVTGNLNIRDTLITRLPTDLALLGEIYS